MSCTGNGRRTNPASQLDAARQRTSAEVIDFDRLDVGEMVGQAVRALGPLHRARGSRLRWLVSGSVRVPVPAALAAVLLAALWAAADRTRLMKQGARVAQRRRRMQDRRTFLGLAAASLLPIDLNAQAQTPATSGATELTRHALSGPLEGFEIVLVQLNSPPGSRSTGPGHRHPGPVLGYVTEGQMLFGINNQPEQVVQTGRTFFEPAGAVHTLGGSAKADAPARAVVFMVVPKGSPLTSPA